jgi:hypothetical protein
VCETTDLIMSPTPSTDHFFLFQPTAKSRRRQPNRNFFAFFCYFVIFHVQFQRELAILYIEGLVSQGAPHLRVCVLARRAMQSILRRPSLLNY